ncbi:MAG: amidohydrolase [Deferribacteraceae bacterium]|jgi:amidohydrolase|nr:amidohydrolase [Deferribacteraceae bacterium]
MQDFTERVKQLAERYYPIGESIRNALHIYPETAFEEVRSSELIAQTLSEHGIEYKIMAKTGVVGLIKGAKSGRTVLLRADMDALKLEESHLAPLCSKRAGYMHACGHDGHVGGLIIAALILNDLKDELSGNIKVVFQPAEESVGGAEPMIEEGLLDNPTVDAAFALHLWGEAEYGEVWVKDGAVMAAPDEFHLRVIGKGGHAAHPQLTIDPIVMSANIINLFQQIISRRKDPLSPAVISVGALHAGEVHNIIPPYADLIGTIRTFDSSIREMLITQMHSAIHAVTDAWGGSYELKIFKRYPAVINDSAMVEVVKAAAAKIIGAEHVKEPPAADMGGEDFAFIANAVASAYLFVGIKRGEEPILHHNPEFAFDTEILKTSSAVFAQIAIDYLSSSRSN